MADTVRIIRLSARNAPDGTWDAGDEAAVSLDEARELLAAGLARLLLGDTLTPLGVESTGPVGEAPIDPGGGTP